MNASRCSFSLIAAVADNGVIGSRGSLPWRLKTDLRRFRALTLGKPVLMGRKTWHSLPRFGLPGPPLPERQSLVLTRDKTVASRDVTVVHTLDDARQAAEGLCARMGVQEVMVIGGAEVYELALPFAQKLYLTQVHTSPEGDAWFPQYSSNRFRETSRESHPSGGGDAYSFTFIDLTA